MNRKIDAASKPPPAVRPSKDRVTVGVRYITEDLITRISKCSLDAVVSLNLTLSKEGGKKIRFIENLEKCRRLETLILSSNIIEKIEKLDKLSRLTELHLAYNNISKFEGLETLTNLQILNLTGNKIETIPAWLPKKLASLQVLKLAKNNIQSLQDVSKLHSLKNLTQTTVAENPVSRLPHCRSYLVFHLRTLETLDGQAITAQERHVAQTRFAHDEIEQLEAMLNQKEAQLTKIQERQNRSSHELEEREVRVKQQQEALRNNQDKIQDLEDEITTKNELLRRKTAELSKACEKHYELEQELAFYKIDHKFESLGKVPSPTGSASEGDDGLIGESPYIGKGRFRQEQLARQRQLRGQHGSESSDSEARERMLQALDEELDAKRGAVDQAQSHLSQLQFDLHTTEQQLMRATAELQTIATRGPQTSLTEDDKEYIRSRMSRKVSKVHKLRDDAADLESAIEHAEHEIEQQHRHMGQLHGQLRRISSKDSLYPSMKREVRDQEVQLEFSNQQYSELQAQLQSMLATIAKETQDIKKLEQELREGQVAHNEEMKQELQGIIDGLQTYLRDVKEKASNQKREYDSLLCQQEELHEKLQDLELENQQLASNEDRVQELRERLADVESELEAERHANQSLKGQLDDTRLRELEDTALSDKLHNYEDVIADLQEQLREQDNQTKMDVASYEKQLEAQQNQAKIMEEKAQEQADLQDEIDNLHTQLRELQKANAKLQDALYAEKQNAKKSAKHNVDPDDLRKRLDKVIKNIQSGKIGLPLRNQHDQVGKALGQLQDTVQNELDRSFHDLEKARRAKTKAEADAAALRDQLAQTEAKERGKAETAVQTQLEDERREMERLKQELDMLKDELELERAAQLGRGSTKVQQKPNTPRETATVTTYSSSVSDSDDTSSIPSSQWSQRRRDLYDSMTAEEQDLFDELQKEIEELRKMLASRDKNAAKKAHAAEKKAAELREMIAKRRRKSHEGNFWSDRKMGPAHRPVAYNDPRLRETADELIQAQDEIDQLHSELREKDQHIHTGIGNTEQSQQTIAAQQDEIDRLTTVLEDQKSEIARLADNLERLTSQPPDLHVSYDDDLRELRQGTANLRSNLASHRPRIQHLRSRSSRATGSSHAESARSRPHPASQRGPRDLLYGTERPLPSDRIAAAYYHPDERGPPRDLAHHGDIYPPPEEYLAPGHLPHHMEAGVPQGGYADPHHGAPEHYPQPGYPQPQMMGPPHGRMVPGTLPGPSYPAQSMAPPAIAGPSYSQPMAGPPAPGMAYPAAHPMTLLPAQPPLQQVPTTPTTLNLADQSFLITPNTPVAGSVLGPTMMATQVTPSGQMAAPVMVSTPLTSPMKLSPVKGILKNTGHPDDEFLCNVPEHHDLEDYISKLQKKVKSLKGKLVQKEEQESEDGRRVVFEDDMEQRAVKRLQGELDERRVELEGLDLAIERQKSNLKHMREKERVLQGRKEHANAELESLRKERTRSERRKVFLSGGGDYDILESDYDYEYNPRSYVTRSEYLVDEIECLEKTLAKRRAELREADQLLHECEEDLVDAKKEGKEMLSKYSEAKSGLSLALTDAATLEGQARDTGVELLKTEEAVQILREEMVGLQELRRSQENMLENIKQVIQVKDSEFQDLDVRVRDAKQHLQEVEGHLQEAEYLQNHKFSLAQENSRALQESQKDVDNVKKELTSCRAELEQADHQLGKSRAQVKMLESTIAKRQSQLVELDKDVEKEIHNKRQEIKGIEAHLESMRQQEREIEENFRSKETQWKQVQSSLEHEEAVLESLATTNKQQRAELHQITQLVQERSDSLQDIAGQLPLVQAELARSRSLYEEEERELKRMQTEKSHATHEVMTLKETLAKVKSDVEDLRQQRDALEVTIETSQKERVVLTESKKSVEHKIEQLHALQSEASDSTRSHQSNIARLERTMQELESDVDELQQEKTQLHTQVKTLRGQIQGGRGDLEQIQNDITEAEMRVQNIYQNEVQKKDDKMLSMEQQIQQLTRENQLQMEQKEVLTNALSKSRDDLEHVLTKTALEREETSSAHKELEGELELLRQQQEDRMKELSSLRDKYNSEITELESIAQAHFSRANRLNDELKYLQAEYVEMKRKMASQQDIEAREKKLEDTINEIKSEIKAEVSDGLAGLEKSRLSAVKEAEQLHSQKTTIGSRLDTLKSNLHNIRSGQPCVPLNLDTLDTTDQLALQQDILKRQLEAKLSQQSAMLQSQRQTSEDSIRQLQLKLSSLAQVLGPTSFDLKPSSVTLSKVAANSQESKAVPPSPKSKRAYSPNSHSNLRQRAQSTENLIPEKGPSS